MSKKQKIKNNKSLSVKTINNTTPYGIFRAKETVRMNNEFGDVVIVKGDDVLLPFSLFKPDAFIFLNHIENIIKPLPKNEITNLNNKKIIIIRYGGIGDIISSLFSISELKFKHPNVQIGYITSNKNADILKNFPKLITFISQPIIKIQSLKMFDYFVCLDNTIESDIESKIIPIQDIYSKYLNIKINNLTLNNILNNNEILNNNQNIVKKGIGIQYKSNAIIRNYNIDNIINLINLLSDKFPSEPIFLLGPPNDYLHIDYILSHSKSNSIIVNGCGFQEYTLYNSLEIVNSLKFVIAPDSSMLHIAGVFNTPMIGLFGPFPSNLRISYYNNAIGLDGTTHCSPCFRHNPQEFCKYNNSQGLCLNSITPELIVENIPNGII